ncbi:MAG: type 4a pilus biogenesis protein PilO [Terriglobia bacterium]
MAALDRFRALPLYSQIVIFVLVAAALTLGGEMLPVSPVKRARDEEADLGDKFRALRDKVSGLQNVQRQHQKLETELEALRKELASVRLIVPGEKQTDEFMRTLQRATISSRISVRRLTAGSVVFKEFYAEMPFEIELDGAFYNVLEFFRRLGGGTRIINASGLRLKGVDTTPGRFQYLPGTTVAGVCTVVTFYTPSQAEVAAAAPAQPTAGRR